MNKLEVKGGERKGHSWQSNLVKRQKVCLGDNGQILLV